MVGKPGTEKLKNDAKQTLNRVVQFVGQSSFGKQLATGTASGWITGAVVSHVGKTAALVVGSSIIVWQVAQHKGYITSDWNELKEQAERKTGSLDSKFGRNAPMMIHKVKVFASKNKTFTAGFLGGFLLGIAF